MLIASSSLSSSTKYFGGAINARVIYLNAFNERFIRDNFW